MIFHFLTIEIHFSEFTPFPNSSTKIEKFLEIEEERDNDLTFLGTIESSFSREEEDH